MRFWSPFLLRKIGQLGLAGFLGLFLIAPAVAQDIDTPGDFVSIMDAETGDIVWNKHGDERMTPSSMTKLMTLDLLFDSLKTGQHKLADTFRISEKAWKMGGSKMFVEVGKEVTIADLLRGIIVQSGNDACIVVAEGLAGSEEAFAERMNAKAQELGMTGSHFANASGWPDPDHYMTANDLAILARHIVTEYPQFYPIFSETEFTYSGIRQYNRHPLIGTVSGVDGLKTGHTEEAGYGLVASGVRDGRRMIIVVNGLESQSQRKDESARLMEVAFRDFERQDVFAKGDTVTFAPVWLGKEKTVPLVVGDQIRFYMPSYKRDKIIVNATYDSPIPAPVALDDKVGTLTIQVPGGEAKLYPLYAGRGVQKAGIGGRISGALRHMIMGSEAAQ